uniref:Uncharacterized protein n=1 Tax=Bionectria ochroleuca TaxID=29856 RepID=A0A0B7K6K8_BIOOC
MTETMRLPSLMKLALCLVGFHPGYPAFANALDSPMITAAPLIARDGPGQIVGSEVIGYASVDGSYSASSCPPGSILKWEGKYGGCVATSATERQVTTECLWMQRRTAPGIALHSYYRQGRHFHFINIEHKHASVRQKNHYRGGFINEDPKPSQYSLYFEYRNGRIRSEFRPG